MKKFPLMALLFLLSACTVFEAGKVSDERKKLYERNNSKEFCENNPDKCINNIPKF